MADRATPNVRSRAGAVGPAPAFVKRYETQVAAERFKAEALHQVARAHGFVAPAVLASNSDVKFITYERLSGLVPLRTCYLEFTSKPRADGSIPPLFRRTGQALAHLHRELALGDPVDWVPPAGFDRLLVRRLGPGAFERLQASPKAFLHGDFGFGNVHLQELAGQQRLVVLDSSPNHYLTVHPNNRGSIYLDLGSFVACLRGLVGIRQFVRIRRSRIPSLIGAFVEGYQSVTGESIDRELLDATGYAIAGTYLRVRYPLPFLAELALRAMFARP